jgi:hypothetical protein
MKVTGFTFIRNAVKFDYPVCEAISSILPVCDDFVIAVGNSDDGTVDLIKSMNSPKIRILETTWDESPEMKILGRVFAVETNKALRAIPEDSDWAFYIQGDEVIHEKYLDVISDGMKKWKDDKKVDGLLFNYKHFYGSYDYVASSPKWYRNEIRIVRNSKSVYSFRDAQGFRKGDDKKLNVKPIDATVYHYGWVKEPSVMLKKVINASSYYEGVKWIKNLAGNEKFDYSSIDSLELFRETHPTVMLDRIQRKNWSFDYDISFNRLSLKYRTKLFLKDYLGINSFYENYTII